MGGPGAPDDLAAGAETQAWLAEGEDDETAVSATYFYHREPQRTPPPVHDEGTQEDLLAYCAHLTGTRV